MSRFQEKRRTRRRKNVKVPEDPHLARLGALEGGAEEIGLRGAPRAAQASAVGIRNAMKISHSARRRLRHAVGFAATFIQTLD